MNLQRVIESLGKKAVNSLCFQTLFLPVILSALAFYSQQAQAVRTILSNKVAIHVAAANTSQSYTTNFDGNENPLSEGGVWSHNSQDWAKIEKSGGIAFGTETGNGGYDDSYALLSGFLPDQTVTAVVNLNPQVDKSCTHEMEILLHFADSAHTARGYECNISFDGGYAQIVRWNGAIGDFTVLGGGNYPNLKTGDVFKASIVGNVITEYVNDQQIAQVTDSVFKDGNPGLGMFRRACGSNSDVSFTSFKATGQ